MAASFQSNYPWAPGVAAVGSDAHSAPQIFAAQIQKQNGQRSFPPTVTAPGTIASAGTVANGTGFDCLVYASATTGITASKVLTYNGANATALTPAGTVPGGAMATFLVPGPGAIALSYTGTLTWTWQAV